MRYLLNKKRGFVAALVALLAVFSQEVMAQCNPSFSGSPCVNSAITFNANSPGFTTYTWNFGDAAPGTSTARDPVYSYTQEGTYTVTYTANGPVGNCSKTLTVVVKGLSGIAESISSTFTLTTAPSVYGTAYGVGSSAAIVVPGFGIVKSGTGWSATASTVGLVSPSPVGTTSAATASGTLNVSTARTTIPLTVQMSQAGTFSYTVAAVTGYTLPSGVTAGTYTYTSPTGVETQAVVLLS